MHPPIYVSYHTPRYGPGLGVAGRKNSTGLTTIPRQVIMRDRNETRESRWREKGPAPGEGEQFRGWL